MNWFVFLGSFMILSLLVIAYPSGWVVYDLWAVILFSAIFACVRPMWRASAPMARYLEKSAVRMGLKIRKAKRKRGDRSN